MIGKNLFGRKIVDLMKRVFLFNFSEEGEKDFGKLV